jgi:phenylacetate-CoA ligase
MSITQTIYSRLPAWSQNIAASLRGYYLNSWRYDAQTEKLVEQFLERDYWSEKEWREWREQRLSEILMRAARSVPFYQELWAKRRRAGDKSSPEYLENWEILEKKTLREKAAAFVADDCNVRRMFCDHTSGTTGTSLNLWVSAATVRYWYAMFEARSRRWYEISRQDRWAILGGQLIVPQRRTNPPFWVWNRGMNQLYLSSYHLAPQLIKDYVSALSKYNVRYLLGYPSAIYQLAREINERQLKIKLDVVIANAEPLYEYQRRAITEAFSCPVRETYGMAETVAAAGECRSGKLHQWLDAGIIEKNEFSDSADVCDFICTGLINPDMPLIRYRVGDCGVFSKESCECGRTLPIINRIEGRADDVLHTPDGRRIGRLDPIFKNDMPIIEAQIIQEKLDYIIVKIIAEAGFNHESEKNLVSRVRERLGDVRVEVKPVTEIERTARGKFRAVICNLPAAEKESLNS